jgi:ATP-dependent DNA helicase PIF1
VALSRVRSMEGIYLTGINQMALTLHPLIFEFDAELRIASEELANITEDAEVEAAVAEDETEMSQSFDEELFARLKSWRYKRSVSDKLPAYMIAHDTVLEDLARRKPQTAQALLGVKGFGQAKADKYGADILEILSANAL